MLRMTQLNMDKSSWAIQKNFDIKVEGHKSLVQKLAQWVRITNKEFAMLRAT